MQQKIALMGDAARCFSSEEMLVVDYLSRRHNATRDCLALPLPRVGGSSAWPAKARVSVIFLWF